MLTCKVYSVMGDIVVEIDCLSHGSKIPHRLIRYRSPSTGPLDPGRLLAALGATALGLEACWVLGTETEVTSDCF